MKIQNIINVALAIIVTALIYQNIQLQNQMEKQKSNLENKIDYVKALAFDNEGEISKNKRELNALGFKTSSNSLGISNVEAKTKSNERKIRLLEVKTDGLELRLDVRGGYRD